MRLPSVLAQLDIFRSGEGDSAADKKEGRRASGSGYY